MSAAPLLCARFAPPKDYTFSWPKKHTHAVGSKVAGKTVLITKQMWKRLTYHCTSGGLEYRHCPECGSTLCIPVEEAP